MKKALTVFTLILLLSIGAFSAELKTVIDALGARESTITIFKQYAVTVDTTVPANITLKFLQGGSFTITGGKTLTINGHVEAGLYQIFEGAGSVSFGHGSIKEAYPQWWGAVADGVNDDLASIQAAIDVLGAYEGGIVFLPAGHYLISDYIDLNLTDVHLVGAGATNTIIFQVTNTKDAIHVSGDYVQVRDLQLRGAPLLGDLTGEIGIKVTAGVDVKIDNVAIFYFDTFGILLDTNVNNKFITNSRIAYNAINIKMLTVHDIVLSGCQLEGEIDTTISLWIQYAYHCTISGNVIEDGENLVFLFEYGERNTIVGNSFNGHTDSSTYVIQIDSGKDNIISGNIINGASPPPLIAGNVMRLDSCENNVISSNVIYGAPAGFYDIWIRNNNTNNIYTNNQLLSTDPTYSIYIEFNGNVDEIITGNYFAKPIDDDSGNPHVITNNVGSTLDRLYLKSPTKLTVSVGGIITITKSYHLVDGDGGIDDNLDTINGFMDGEILILQAEDDAVTITIRDGIGNIQTEGGIAIVLDDVEDKAYLFYDATNSVWVEISRFTG